jgi:hypothetical protein
MIEYENDYICYHLRKMSGTNTDANKGNVETETIDLMSSSLNNFISDMRKVDAGEEHMNTIIDKVSTSDEMNDILRVMNSIMECKKHIKLNTVNN